MNYFRQLKEKIDERLDELGSLEPILEEAATKQKKYKWLYGALGKVPSCIMFICENPSLSGIKKAKERAEKLGAENAIEAQWWGGKAGTVFRPALFKLGLKTTPPDVIGGWKCYITNVIKQADITNEHRNLTNAYLREQARNWADILQWEIEKVNPRKVICVGGSADTLVNYLEKENLITLNDIYKVIHYSAYLKKEEIINRIIQTVGKIL